MNLIVGSHLMRIAEADPTDVEGLVDVAAARIGHTIELLFIKDPKRSMLEFLGPGRKEHWEQVEWGPDDFPGDGGQNEGQARAMFNELASVRSERRPHIGATKITNISSISQQRWEEMIKPNTVPVTGVGLRKNKFRRGGHHGRMMPEPAEALERMSRAAVLDGIPLEAESISRSPDEALRNAQRRGNRQAVAELSSHMLGGTIDFTLAPPQNDNFSVTNETSTSSMHSYVFEYYRSAVAKWLYLYSEDFGFHMFKKEPWHFEYNPEGYSERFQEVVMHCTTGS